MRIYADVRLKLPTVSRLLSNDAVAPVLPPVKSKAAAVVWTTLTKPTAYAVILAALVKLRSKAVKPSFAVALVIYTPPESVLNRPLPPAGLVKLAVTPPLVTERLERPAPRLEKSKVMSAAVASNDSSPKHNAKAKEGFDKCRFIVVLLFRFV